MKIADRVMRLGKGRIDDRFFDSKTYSARYKSIKEKHIMSIEELNESAMNKKALEELYIGKRIKIIYLRDEDDRYVDKEGEVTYVDDIGQLHGTWGGVAIIPSEDSFELLG